MADDAGTGTSSETGTDQQQGTDQTGASSEAGGQPNGGTTETGGDDKGKGGKEAVLADLATERDKRQAAEKQFTEFTDGLKKLLGGGEEKLTPTQLQEKLAAATASADTSALELALYKAGAGTVNVDALLDSRAFMQSLSGLKASDSDGIKAKIEAVKDDPRYRVGSSSAGAADAGADSRPPVANVNDWIRNAASR